MRISVYKAKEGKSAILLRPRTALRLPPVLLREVPTKDVGARVAEELERFRLAPAMPLGQVPAGPV